jgi:hypothetical protein
MYDYLLSISVTIFTAERIQSLSAARNHPYVWRASDRPRRSIVAKRRLRTLLWGKRIKEMVEEELYGENILKRDDRIY